MSQKSKESTSKLIALVLRHKPEEIGITLDGLYVHLSPDYDTAVKVGSRHGKPVVYTVAAGEMQKNGYVFYQSVNGVWLTKNVPVDYLRKEDRR